ncbi:MAG: hypothetical protein A2848_03640 [Candidatus Magasanikbacteria bacterium RIFCSPHIGHO2_01_FULL_50_8]|uniref:PRC-barrel domain-containing protein n=2 Tax=Candidatus Magasanikiibacteriota TaxID=1752731 RepID=A0A1F6LRN1_9BACT|nr:MAG: hypothetical protein A2848_03640 [Candidatus Magasanikbacteria bacterium RIFCSPHIGHO2_01_FULL_50_8]OGH68223.1 MAG: hypothetical protein A3C15_01205 [Candidatus Magasanikbacteria bacterium RIFCSPHIGHO2_02_FULL_50_9b]
MRPLAVHELHNRTVITQAGSKLGSLKDVVIDVDSGRVLQYCVKQGLLPGQELLIGADAVIEISDDAIVVKDAIVPVATTAAIA